MPIPELLEQAHAAGRAAWPDVPLDIATFGRRVQALGLDGDPLLARAADVYLATACLSGDTAALQAFERGFLLPLPRMFGHLGLTHHQQDELRQRLRIRLLVGPEPKIADYRALGALGGWVRVAALRLALNLKGEQIGKGGEDAAAVDALLASAGVAEGDLDVVNHQEAFRSALHKALSELPAREKTILRLHFLDGMNIDALAVVFRVHRATAARWLVSIRANVLETVRNALSLEIGASASEAQSLVRLLRSEVQVSIRRLLDGDGS
jgi:RNA polymerase sigma-70 factor (ECF subfamily)